MTLTMTVEDHWAKLANLPAEKATVRVACQQSVPVFCEALTAMDKPRVRVNGRTYGADQVGFYRRLRHGKRGKVRIRFGVDEAPPPSHVLGALYQDLPDLITKLAVDPRIQGVRDAAASVAGLSAVAGLGS